MLYEKFPEHRYRNRKASVENTMWNTGGKNNKKIDVYKRQVYPQSQDDPYRRVFIIEDKETGSLVIR